MKLAQSMAPSSSDRRRPSRKPNTSPQIMPSARPLTNRQAMFQGAGISANRIRQTSAAPIRARMAAARRAAAVSEMTLTPATLDRA